MRPPLLPVALNRSASQLYVCIWKLIRAFKPDPPTPPALRMTRGHFVTSTCMDCDAAIDFYGLSPGHVREYRMPPAPFDYPKWQAPVKNELNKPESIRVACEWIANLKGISVAAVIEATNANARRIFPRAFPR